MKIDNSLLSGSTSMLVMSLLIDGDKYGYEMISELMRRSDNTFALKEGTLYPLLHTLEKAKYVKSYMQTTPNGRERKYYSLTDSGRRQLDLQTGQWLEFSGKVNMVLGFTAPAMA
jgi:PadR family transcriptional regulator PadR